MDSARTTPGATSEYAESASLLSRTLPDEPLIKIRPQRSWIGVSVQDLWTHRELLYFLTWRDLKVRYKQTVLGVAWAIMQPLFTMIIFTLFFGRLAGMPSDGVPYPVFVYVGLVIWTFFSNAVTSSGNSLVANAQLLSKVYFPRMIIPGSAILAGMVDFAIAFVVLVGLMIYYGMAPTGKILLVPVLFALITLLAFSVGMWLSAMNVKYRDIRFALPFVVQLWMFLSPVIYPSSLVPARWRWLLALNPLTGIIDNFRVSLFGNQEFNWMTLGAATIITLALFIYSTYVFWRMEENFADIV